MSKYRKIPVVVEAVQFKAGNYEKIRLFAGEASKRTGNSLCISTDHGFLPVRDGDWVIKGIKGEFYPCEDEVFQKTYEAYDG